MWEAIRKQYPFLRQHPELIYFDNAATALKPKCVIDALMCYYEEESVNVHRSGYRLAKQVDTKYETARREVASFLEVEKEDVIFTFGTTDGMNRLANGLQHYFQKGDVILTTQAEHASCILPWMKVAKKQGVMIEFIPLKNGRLEVDTLQTAFHEKVKAVVLAQVGNVLGYHIDLKKVSKCCHNNGALLIVDGAQSVMHTKHHLKEDGVDAFVFSAHKLGATTGCGAMYLSKKLQVLMEVSVVGGTSNCYFDEAGNYELCEGYRGHEAGTPPIEGAIALGKVCNFLSEIGMEHIIQREKELHVYCIQKLSQIKHVKLYNTDADISIITFNIKDIHAQDAAAYFDAHGICLRSGQHCARLLKNVIDTSATLRISLSFYNTFEEIDRFITVCEAISLEACLDLYI